MYFASDFLKLKFDYVADLIMPPVNYKLLKSNCLDVISNYETHLHKKLFV